MADNFSIRNLLQSAQQQLSAIESARLDAEILLANVIGQNRSFLYTHPEHPVSRSVTADFNSLVSKRAAGFPLSYLTGYKEFWSIHLTVNRSTLIPRPETELLVETVLDLTRDDAKTDILDLGTGSGAIAVAIASERTAAKIVATDISAEALATASENARSNQLTNIRFIQSDWFGNLGSGRFDIILSNPPYVQANDPGLITGELRHEPRIALDGGITGLDAYKRIIPGAGSHLSKHGWLLLEHGYNQGQAVRDLLKHSLYRNIESRCDYSGHERVTLAQFPH